MPKTEKDLQMKITPKTAAVVAAVVQYIKSEEEAIAMQFASYAVPPPMPAIFQPPAPQPKPWGLSGRQAQMQMRNLMQLRTFHRR
jgi:hypothetical protein